MTGKVEKKGLGKRILRWGRNILIVIFAGAILLVLAGLAYEKISENRDSKKYNPPGQIIDINGHGMHVYAKGIGKATVVFASGWGIPCPYAEYYPLYEEISRFTRVVVYDRPGYGWSETSDSPRDIDTITQEIHELLEKSGEKPPYILVGHSLASLEVLRFAQLYTEEVQGIVLLDAGNPEYYANETLNDEATSSLSLKSVLSKTGVFRLLFKKSPSFLAAVYAPRNDFSLVPSELKDLDQAMYLKNMVNKSKSDEIDNLKTNASIVAASKSIGEIPLVILTSEDEASDPEWKSSQEALTNWSTISQQKILLGTNHNMHLYVPDIINLEILRIFTQ